MKKPEEKVFGAAAISAYEAIVTKNEESKLYKEEDWCAAVRLHSDKESMLTKDCPKNTFRVLCEDGYLIGITGSEAPHYKGKDERAYVMSAIEILVELKTKHENSGTHSFVMEGPITIDYPLTISTQLWAAVLNELGMPGDKHHDGQMDVVLALWEKGKIKPTS